MGPGARHPVHQLVDPKDVPVEELPLALLWQHGIARFGYIAVAVPFYILYIVVANYLGHLVEDIVPDLPAGHVQHALVAAEAAVPPLGLDYPVRVGPIEVAVGVHHLRLVPYAEAEPLCVHPLDKALDAALQLVLVHLPVAQGLGVVVPGAEPAVVHHQHVHAQLLCLSGEVHQEVIVEVEHRRLPAVYQQGALLMGPLTAHEVVHIEPVEAAAHAAKAIRAEHGYDLGGLEYLPGLQMPAKAAGVYARQDPRTAQGVHLGLYGEVAAVDYADAHGLPLVLVRALAQKGHEGVMVGAGHAPFRADALYAVHKRVPGDGVLLGPAAVHVHHVVVH